MAELRTWLLLAYSVPREPTAGRVYVWRKLKRLGAVALQDAVWVLPNTPQALEQFRWLAAEVVEMRGEASLWEAKHLLEGQEQQLVREFEGPVKDRYREILSALKKKNPDLPGLSRQYQQVLAQDYFRCDAGRQVREALLAARDGAGPDGPKAGDLRR